jgi:predicted kinase
MLIVFGGLPGTGKTTISRVIATRHSATYLRINAIKQAIRGAVVLDGGVDIGPAGYLVANVLAESNLTTGRIVVADCVIRSPRAALRGGRSHLLRKSA